MIRHLVLDYIDIDCFQNPNCFVHRLVVVADVDFVVIAVDVDSGPDFDSHYFHLIDLHCINCIDCINWAKFNT